jgi:flagellar basal-body rod protein FlgB
VFESTTIRALTSALDGLAERQRTIANNIANVNTPGYHARRVSFEDALARSVANHDGAVSATESLSTDPTRLDGNNVNLDTETLDNIETLLRYQIGTQAVNQQFQSVRAALGSAS